MKNKKTEKKKRVRLLLPGFHTGTDWKMTLAVLYYIIVVLLSVTRGPEKGIIIFIFLMAGAYLIYGIMGLFSKQKKYVMSALYIVIALLVIGGDGVIMSVSGLSVSDIMKNKAPVGQTVASSVSYSSGTASKTSSKTASSEGKTSKNTSQSSRVSEQAVQNNSGTQQENSAAVSDSQPYQLNDDDIFTAEKDVENSLNSAENSFDGSENRANAVQLYYIKKHSIIYHTDSKCPKLSGKNIYTITAEEAEKRVMIPCGSCVAK